LVLNFLALYLGSLVTNGAVMADWYQNLNKAPWTPPGWVFGTMWTLIMICLAVFMSFHVKDDKIWDKVLKIYGLQILFNIMWNPVYFLAHWQLTGLVVLICLFGLVLSLYRLGGRLKPSYIKYLLLPYLIWLLIAFSLNAYTWLYN